MKTTRARVRRNAIGLAAAIALAAAGAAATAATTATHATATHAPGQGARTSQAARARASLLSYLSSGVRPQAQLARDGGLRPGDPNLKAGATAAAQVGSFNWSGYADSGDPGTFTAVSGRWREPATVCSQEQRLTAFWVGLDGFTNSTVEQDGTFAYCFEGKAYYYTWWEMFPADSVTVGSAVRPGDLITASVTASGTSYTLSLTDSTRPANSFSTVQTCLPADTCQNASAEWIAERPAFEIGVAPLSIFTDWSLSRGRRTANDTPGSIGSGPGATQITMVDATLTYPLDRISGLHAGGSRFTARWLNSY